MYYFIVETLQGEIVIKSPLKEIIKEMYDKHLKKCDFLTISKIYYKNN